MHFPLLTRLCQCKEAAFKLCSNRRPLYCQNHAVRSQQEIVVEGMKDLLSRVLADQRPSCLPQKDQLMYNFRKSHLATQINSATFQSWFIVCISISFDIYWRNTNSNMFDQVYVLKFKGNCNGMKKRTGMKLIFPICYSCISSSSSCLIHIILQMIWQSGLRGCTGEEGSRDRRNIARHFSCSVIISQAVAKTPRGWWKTSRSWGSSESLRAPWEMLH